MNKELLHVRGLKTYFHTFAGVIKAVDGVDFSLDEGEILGVVGESGCGKSVVGFSIMGLIDAPGRIDSGEIRFNGVDLPDLDEREMRKVRGKEITMIFQDPMTSLNPLYTVQAQMEEVMKLHSTMNAEQRRNRCIELLDNVGISQPASRLKNYPHQFSGGMRQRVIIAIALASNPKLVIADEPTTALDVTIQSQILKLMKRLVREHRTAMMLITHDLAVVSEMTDKIIVMYCGRIVEKGTRDDIINNCRHPYTLGLLGSIPNLASRQKRLSQIPGMVPNIMHLPPGCAFAPRCDHVQEKCRIHRPELLELEPGHATACYYPVKR
ncbi:MAG: ABC transporter ATP-binding protein [Desulfobacterales bacterium]|nr:ABC transporter ATP-binding protein [Desulfobacterales bacterium]